jgi:hypothetical protein
VVDRNRSRQLLIEIVRAYRGEPGEVITHAAAVDIPRSISTAQSSPSLQWRKLSDT